MGAAEPAERLENEPWREEQIDGTVYAMSCPSFAHSRVSGNIQYAIRHGLGNGPCGVYNDFALMYHRDSKDERKAEDYVVPDVMIVCGHNIEQHLYNDWGYTGTPKFVAEIVSPSTMKRDRTDKMRIYEKVGVSEYWIVNPSGVLEIYYLADGHYALEGSYILSNNKDYEDYNGDTVITLRELPEVSMTLSEIFE